MHCIHWLMLCGALVLGPAPAQDAKAEPDRPTQAQDEKAQQSKQETEQDEQTPPADDDEPQTTKAAAATPAVAGPAGLPYGLRGSVDARYIGRWTENAHDNDLRSWVVLDFGDARRHLVSGHASGRGNLDMDRDRSPTHPFRTVDDTYSADVAGQLYAAYVDLNGVEGNPLRGVLSRVRLGRQILYDTPETLFLDGVSFETAACPELADLVVSGFVGVPNHLFESSPEGDISTGAAVTASPWRGGQLRFDYVHVTDDYLGATAQDDLFGLSGHQRFDSHLFVDAHLNLIGSDARDFLLHAAWSLPEEDLTLTARYNALWSDQKRRSIDFDYFTPILQTYFAYDQYELFGHKGFGDDLFVDGGVQFRELREDSNEGVFNHEFRRYYLTPGVQGWPAAGTTITLTGEIWDSGGDDFTALGGDLNHEFDDRLSGAIGTFFQLYRYDALTDQERENVQVSYAKVFYQANEFLRLRASIEFENGDEEDYLTVILGAKIDF